MKKYIFTIFISILVLFCIIAPSNMINATKSALTLWATIIIPSLFPFMILADLIQKTALPFLFQKIFSPLMKVIFKLPGISILAVFLGMAGGYPVGAKVTSDLLSNNEITPSDANHLIMFVNNTGPLFMLGAVGIGLYKNIYIGILLLLSHYISAILVGFIIRFTKPKSNELKNSYPIEFKAIKLSDIGSTLNDTIKKSIDTVLSIGGFIILFSIISALIEQSKILSFVKLPGLSIETSTSLITGLLEVTNGVNKIAMANTPLLQKLIISSILIGFGGMSIHFQTLSIISNVKISFIKYLIGKTIQSILSGIITFLLISYTRFSILIPLNVSLNIQYNSVEFSRILNTISIFLILSILFKLSQILFNSHKKTNLK